MSASSRNLWLGLVVINPIARFPRSRKACPSLAYTCVSIYIYICMCMGVSQNWGYLFGRGFPVIRIVIFRGLCWGAPL